ncbi:MAG: sigma-70 family RNA polymerase sigma factor [Verrucomicrobia bacterium]|nr:sigma-70 family RNA polymerase sigma factor [Verrucomicrobiota bacterium]
MATSADEFIPTRKSLLSRLKDWQDQESWRDFFNTYWKLIYSVAIKAGLTDSEAQEVVQETVITVAKKMPDFRYDPAIGSFKSWLLTITRRRITDQYRKRRSNSVSEEFAVSVSGESEGTSRTSTLNRIAAPASFDIEAVWDQDWERNLTDVALEKVKRLVRPKQFQMFDLHVMRDWPAQMVAATLHTTMARVYYAKFKITALLRKEMKHLEKNMGRL